MRCLAFISLARVAARDNAAVDVRCRSLTSSLFFAGQLAAVCNVEVFELRHELGVSLSKLIVENLELNLTCKLQEREIRQGNAEMASKWYRN